MNRKVSRFLTSYGMDELQVMRSMLSGQVFSVQLPITPSQCMNGKCQLEIMRPSILSGDRESSGDREFA